MTRLDRRQQALAIALAAVAGYADACGFLLSGGFFVSFMSGNSTRLGVHLAGSMAAAGAASVLLLSFLLGVTAAALVGPALGRWRKAGLIWGVALCLIVAAALLRMSLAPVGVALIALGMGAINLTFDRAQGETLGLTYMTGAVVRAGQALAAWLTGRPLGGGYLYVALWLALVSGAAVGGWAAVQSGVGALTGAAAMLTVLGLAAAPHSPTPERA